jgi:protoporphyrin/coproporphyrin ferrochelatase
MIKRAVVIFNLGGPDNPNAVQPFLFNLFNDAAIIDLPNPFRWLIAKIISARRAPIAIKIYDEIGGKSPLLDLTQKQATALEVNLNKNKYINSKVFIAMRYWHPLTLTVAMSVKKFNPDEIILLPLYPQFSTTTTGSSFKEWKSTANKIKLKKPTKEICCYPINENLIKAHTFLLKKEVSKAKQNVRVLFSAHGLPKKIIQKGDPYQWQVEKTAKAIAVSAKLNENEWRVCYQSRVGPLEWIGPSLDEEIKNASDDNLGIVILPIAFVSEHSETLVELDIEYRNLAKHLSLPYYGRVPAIGTHPDFIFGLEKLINDISDNGSDVPSKSADFVCPINLISCGQRNFN